MNHVLNKSSSCVGDTPTQNSVFPLFFSYVVPVLRCLSAVANTLDPSERLHVRRACNSDQHRTKSVQSRSFVVLFLLSGPLSFRFIPTEMPESTLFVYALTCVAITTWQSWCCSICHRV